MRSLGRAVATTLVAVLAFAIPGAIHSSARVHSSVPSIAATTRPLAPVVPMSFEPNVRQAGTGIRFLGRSSAMGVGIGAGQVVLSLRDRASGGPAPTVRLRFVGTGRPARIVGSRRLPGVSNYLIGSNPGAWRTNVPHFGVVTYRQLYPGIDLTLYGNDFGRLEYDFELQPGATPSAIDLEVDGGAGFTLGPDGALVLALPGRGTLVQPRPSLYQMVDGARRPVAGSYVLGGKGVRFAVGPYDHSRALVIDPEVEYSTYLGGSGDDVPESASVAVDGSGHAYVCGDTDSIDFPTTTGSFQPSYAGGQDAFLVKFNRNGTDLLWSTYVGGTGYEEGVGCGVDPSGQAFLTGPTTSTDFPVTKGALQTAYGGGEKDAYVVKVDRTGSKLVYGTYLGGSEADEGSAVAPAPSGDVVVKGFTDSADFPTTPGTVQPSYAGGVDSFVAKLSRDGSRLDYSTYLGGSGFEFGFGIAADQSGQVFVSGVTTSSDFPVTAGAYQPTLKGGDPNVCGCDGYVASLTRDGSGLRYSTYVGGSGEDWPEHIAIDRHGHAYVEGFTDSTDFPTSQGAFQPSIAGGDGGICFGPPCDAFVFEVNRGGSNLAYSTYLGGTGDDLGFGLVVDRAGQAVVATFTTSVDFPVTSDARQPENAGAIDGTLTKLTSDGSAVVFSTYLGGSNVEFGGPLAIDQLGSVYDTGCTGSLNYPTTPGAFQDSFQGGDGTGFCGVPADGVLTKFTFDHRGTPHPVVRGTGAGQAAGTFFDGSRKGRAAVWPATRSPEGISISRDTPGPTSSIGTHT